jgi:hypothetical protein
VTATDSLGATATQFYTVTINPPVTITTSSLTDWTLNIAGYDQTIANSGGTGADTFAVTIGTLPTGLSLNAATGSITGTPTATGTFNFTVTVTDAVGATAAAAYKVVINAAVAIKTTTLVAWTAGLSGYSQTIAMTNTGTGVDTFSISSGSLPAGLALSSVGVIAGTPTTAGTSTFTLTATDSVGSTASETYTVTINPAISFTTTSLLNWTLNFGGYSQTIVTTGGTGTVKFTVTSGSLPTGLTLSAAGLLHGKPTLAGTHSFTVTATDSLTATAAQSYTVTINPPVTITTPTLADWTVNIAGYNQTVAATGGTGADTFSVSSGSLPTGLSLDPATGSITGTLTGTGTFRFTVTATDTVGATAAMAYKVVINAAVAIKTSSLAAWTVGFSGNGETIAMTSTGTGVDTFSVPPGSLPAGLALSSTGVISGTPTTTGNYTFTLTVTDSVGSTASETYTVTINPAISFTTTSLPNWTHNVAGYSQPIVTSGGTGTVKFTITAGSLPTGLTLSVAGLLHGKPTVIGTFTFTVTATDSLGATAMQSYTVIIS